LSATGSGRPQGIVLRHFAHRVARLGARGAVAGVRYRRTRAQAPHPVSRRQDARASRSGRDPRAFPRARGGPARGRERGGGREGGSRPDDGARNRRGPADRRGVRRSALPRGRSVFSAFLIASFILAAVAPLNPNTALFFAAFLPQFMNAEASVSSRASRSAR